MKLRSIEGTVVVAVCSRTVPVVADACCPAVVVERSHGWSPREVQRRVL
jgi:hypothetical protein